MIYKIGTKQKLNAQFRPKISIVLVKLNKYPINKESPLNSKRKIRLKYRRK